MLRFLLPAALLCTAVVVARPEPVAPSAPARAAAAPLPHCQVPCGIYGDMLRIDLLLEDVATIEKAMAQIAELGAADDPNFNQLVRWVTTKDDHAQKIQDQVAAYWLAQRVKSPSEDSERAKYLLHLERMHGITVAAMKCKQTTDAQHAARVRELALAFGRDYFTAEDLEHLREHHGALEHEHGDDEKGR